MDYRIYDPPCDGKTKLDHVKEMLSVLVCDKKLPFERVVMLTWYATKAVMLHIEHLQISALNDQSDLKRLSPTAMLCDLWVSCAYGWEIRIRVFMWWCKKINSRRVSYGNGDI